MDNMQNLLILKSVARAVPAVWEHLSEETIKLIYQNPYESNVKAAGDLGQINRIYHDTITGALLDYFEGGGIAASRNEFKQACITAFSDAFDIAWIDAGAELPIDDAALSWVEGRINEEFTHIEALFEEAKELRRDKEFDYFAWATARADGYTNTLAAVYNEGRLRAADNVMVTWHLGATEKHCKTCASLDGKRHKIKWFLDRNYIPRKPDAGMECHGYNCDCSLIDDKGSEYTV